jgi:hypothetical protein
LQRLRCHQAALAMNGEPGKNNCPELAFSPPAGSLFVVAHRLVRVNVNFQDAGQAHRLTSDRAAGLLPSSLFWGGRKLVRER